MIIYDIAWLPFLPLVYYLNLAPEPWLYKLYIASQADGFACVRFTAV